ncbi:MAG: hypothetical protein ABI204_01205 [Ginsengibacter sp.]
MNLLRNKFLSPLTKTELQQISLEVKEVLATSLMKSMNSSKKFTNVDLWNIQRQKKSLLHSRS